MSALDTLRRRERTIAAVRLALLFVLAGMVLADAARMTGANSMLVLLMLSAVGIFVEVALRVVRTPSAWLRASLVVLAADSITALTFVWLSQESVDAWAVLALLPLSAALRFRLWGGLVAATVLGTLYMLLEGAGQGGPSIGTIFTRGLLLVFMGAFAGLIAHELDQERRLYQRMVQASQDIAAQRGTDTILQTLARHIAATMSSTEVVVYGYELTGFTELVASRPAQAGLVIDGELVAPIDPATSHILHRVTWRAAEPGLPGRLTLPLRAPERPAEHVIAIRLGGSRPDAITESALRSLCDATMVALTNVALLRNQEAATRRLQRLEALRTRFVATVAHDLRSPLTTVKGVAKILRSRRETVSPERVDSMLASVERQANRLNRLADDLLDAARLDSEKLHLNLEKVDLGRLVAGVLADVEDDIEAHLEEGVLVEVDGPRVERIVWNLVSNAQKYGRPPLVVRVSTDQQHAHLTVRDHGKGLTEDQVATLFTDFAGRDDPDSVGLGLAIVWQLVKAHDGSVTYEPADPGAAFVVTLPR